MHLLVLDTLARKTVSTKISSVLVNSIH